MKIKLYSWFLAGAYLFWGMLVFFAMPYFLSIFSKEGIQKFPLFSTAVFTIGPSGWLLITAVIGTIVILKDLMARPPIPNSIFTITLLLLAGGIIFAVASTT